MTTKKEKEQTRATLERQVESQRNVVAVTLSRYKAAKHLAKKAPYEHQREYESEANGLKWELASDRAEYYRLYSQLHELE